MRVLVVGSGAREHALALRINRSPQLTRLWVASGNAGTGQIATNLPIHAEDIEGIVEAAQSLAIDLVVVGPDVPLANGIVDRLNVVGIPVFGPTRAAAQLEWSKSYAIKLMWYIGVPHAESVIFYDSEEAERFVWHHGSAFEGVVKADGLARGKGVFVCRSAQKAIEAIQKCVALKEAGKPIIVQELLEGPEVSVFAFCDGERISKIVAVCDYKPIGEGNTGPNTGSMGSYSPPEFWNDDLDREAQRIMQLVVSEMARRGTPYKGILYGGFMLINKGLKVLEFNVRLGDAEAQVILLQLVSDPLEVMMACVEGRLEEVPVVWDVSRSYVGVVMASDGYPDPAEYETGFEITESPYGHFIPNTVVFHAGTKQEDDGRIVTNGGRVMTVVGWGTSLQEARSMAYRRVETIQFKGVYYRRDIAGEEPREMSAWSLTRMRARHPAVYAREKPISA